MFLNLLLLCNPFLLKHPVSDPGLFPQIPSWPFPRRLHFQLLLASVAPALPGRTTLFHLPLWPQALPPSCWWRGLPAVVHLWVMLKDLVGCLALPLLCHPLPVLNSLCCEHLQGFLFPWWDPDCSSLSIPWNTVEKPQTGWCSEIGSRSVPCGVSLSDWFFKQLSWHVIDLQHGGKNKVYTIISFNMYLYLWNHRHSQVSEHIQSYSFKQLSKSGNERISPYTQEVQQKFPSFIDAIALYTFILYRLNIFKKGISWRCLWMVLLDHRTQLRPALCSNDWPLSCILPSIFILGNKNENRQISFIILRSSIWAFGGCSWSYWHLVVIKFKRYDPSGKIAKMLSYVSVLNSGNLGRAQIQKCVKLDSNLPSTFPPVLILLQMFCIFLQENISIAYFYGLCLKEWLMSLILY